MVPPNTNEATTLPHIYKKGRILKFKKLNEGIDRSNRRYLFTSNGSGIASVIHHCNNLNQIVGRNFLGIAKLLSYFGLSKDPSEEFSKNSSIFNKFSKDHPSSSRGDSQSSDLKDLKNLLERQNSRILDLEKKIDSLAKDLDKNVAKSDIENLNSDLRKQLKEIDESLKKILG